MRRNFQGLELLLKKSGKIFLNTGIYFPQQWIIFVVRVISYGAMNYISKCIQMHVFGGRSVHFFSISSEWNFEWWYQRRRKNLHEHDFQDWRSWIRANSWTEGNGVDASELLRASNVENPQTLQYFSQMAARWLQERQHSLATCPFSKERKNLIAPCLFLLSMSSKQSPPSWQPRCEA